MQPNPANGSSGDRAALAHLRRCSSVAAAMSEPATITLFRACAADQPEDLERIALTAAVLAHVRDDKPAQKLARSVGPQDLSDPASALLKPLRFQRLMTASTSDERLIAMRRLVALAGGAVNLRDLIEALLFWDDKRRIQWTYDYWGAGQPATQSNRPTLIKDPAA